jgi:hypothetical protein
MKMERATKLSWPARIAEATLGVPGHYRRLYVFAIVSAVLAVAFGFFAQRDQDPHMVTLAVAWALLAALWAMRGGYVELLEKRFLRT